MVAFAVLLGWVSACVLEPALWKVFGTFHVEPVFLDAYAITAAGEAHTLGESVATSNWRDPLGREHAYSDWWLRLWPPGFGVAHTAAVAAGFLLAGLTSILWVAGPRDGRTLGVFLAFWFSPACLVVLNRANNDLLIYACVGGVIAGVARGGVVARGVALGLGTLAAGLKFYPVVLGALALLGGRTWRARVAACAVVGVVGLGLAAWFVFVPGAWPRSIPNPPVDWTNTFGARYLALLFGADAARATQLAGVVVVLQSLLTAWLLRGMVLPDVSRREQVAFVAGAALGVSTFVVGGSFEYRIAALTFCLPYLVALTRTPGRTRWVGWGVLAGVVAFAWSSGVFEFWAVVTGSYLEGVSAQLFLMGRAVICWVSLLVLAATALIWVLRELDIRAPRTDLHPPRGQAG